MAAQQEIEVNHGSGWVSISSIDALAWSRNRRGNAMNATQLTNETEIQATETSTQTSALNELCAVELAYVGGGMANVCFI
jgi:hypothetical protein